MQEKSVINSCLEIRCDWICETLRAGHVQFPNEYDTSVLRDKSVFITEGASGIAAASVKTFLAAGGYVIFTDFNEEGGRKFESEVGERGLALR